MPSLEKLVERFLQEPTQLRFEEVERLLETFGYSQVPRRSGSSHHVFCKPGQPPIVVPVEGGRWVKRTYIPKIVDLLDLKEWYELRKKG